MLLPIDTVMFAAGPIATDRAEMLRAAERMVGRVLLRDVGGSVWSTATSTSIASLLLLLLLLLLGTTSNEQILLSRPISECPTNNERILLLQDDRVEAATARAARATVVAGRERSTATSVQQRNVRLQVGLQIGR